MKQNTPPSFGLRLVVPWYYALDAESYVFHHLQVSFFVIFLQATVLTVCGKMETESVRSARSEPPQRLHNNHRHHHHHRPHRHRGHSDRDGGAPEQQRPLRGGHYDTDQDTDRDDRSVSTRASRVHHRVPDVDDRGSQWGETTTVLTGATSEFNYSLEDADESRNPENGIGFRCARYAGSVFAGMIGLVAFLSPIAMLVLPRVGIGRWQLSICRPDCEGMLISVGFKLLILAAGAWALFIRQPRATMPRLAVSRAGVLVLTFILTFSFWLFYGVRIYKPDGSEPVIRNYSDRDDTSKQASFCWNLSLSLHE